MFSFSLIKTSEQVVSFYLIWEILNIHSIKELLEFGLYHNESLPEGLQVHSEQIQNN